MLALTFSSFTTTAFTAQAASSWFWWRSANEAPLISGAPAAFVAAGSPYSFVPRASDPDGNALRFMIRNRPSWATFDAISGALRGTPQAANVGTYRGITIYVTDGRKTVSLPSFGITVTASSPAASPPATTTNAAPKIGGAPPTSVLASTAYAFKPTASDANGDALTFAIANKPAWATFSTATGQLSGTPTAADIGTTAGIAISVTDGKATASLPAFAIAVQGVATGSATLTWQPPTQNADGSPLTSLAGFKVYWGPAQGEYSSSENIDNPGLASYVIANLVPGTYYFAVTALNSAGTESAFSNVASKQIR
jgi:hypothetical protein